MGTKFTIDSAKNAIEGKYGCEVGCPFAFASWRNFSGQPFSPVGRLFISFCRGPFEVFSDTFDRLTQSQNNNFSRKKCHITCVVRAMYSGAN